MKRTKAGEEGPIDPFKIAEEERRNALIGVITNVALFGAIVLALRVGMVIYTIDNGY